MTPKNHFDKLADLLHLEAAAEAEQFAQALRNNTGAGGEKRGTCLTKLAIRDEAPALAGRMLLMLGKRDQTQSLPWHRFYVGTPVLLTEEQVTNPESMRGVVCERSQDTITVAVADLPSLERDRPTLRLDLATDAISRDRQLNALRTARDCTRGRLHLLKNVLLGNAVPKFTQLKKITPHNANLNASQIAAVEFALSASDCAIIHGPPGTGKTTTVVELICQAVARGEQVLACAASNLAVDNLLERLVLAGVNAVRLGHPARVMRTLQSHTLDSLVENHADVSLARKLLKEANKLRDKAGKYTRAKPLPGARQELRQEARELVADARHIEQQVVTSILDNAQVLCCTLTGVDAQLLADRQFPLLVIEEASQAIEPACWIPLSRAEKVVFAGDHCQLPPTVISLQAAKAGLACSLPERLLAVHGVAISQLLTMQYRMHATLMQFSSQEFYEGRLVAHASVQSHSLEDLLTENKALNTAPLQFIDTAGAGYDESSEAASESLCNESEAELIIKKTQALLDAGLSAADIGIISPYSAQVRLITERLGNASVEVDTVDGFQGREKEVILLSLVRSNQNGEIGFLQDIRRMNVALTRARRQLIIVGDSATLANHAFYTRLLNYIEANNAYSTVWQEWS
jgi:ATP-dependent RNA/DNA helicase IGHMBP2